MRNRDFFDINHAAGYLKDSIIRVANDPVYIYNVVEGGRRKAVMTYCPLKNMGDMQQIPLDHADVDMNPVPLGMCTWFDGDMWVTYHVSRYPVRAWKVGLSRNNIGVTSITGRGQAGEAVVDQVFATVALDKCIRGEYKSLKDTLELLKKHRGAIPISRRFAVASNNRVYYDTVGKHVGTIEAGRIVLNAEHGYLAEVLKQDLAA